VKNAVLGLKKNAHCNQLKLSKSCELKGTVHIKAIVSWNLKIPSVVTFQKS
jgi:hypothetical protein